MNQRSDIDRVLQVWMEDGPSVMPDRIVDVVADRISGQSQRRSWRLLRRLSMNPFLKLGAAAAAVLVVAVVGYNLLPGPPGTGGQPSPTPSASPTASPSATFAYPSLILPPGSHATASFLPAFTYTVAEPWVLDGDTAPYYSLFPDSPANRAEWARTGNPANGFIIASDLLRPWFACEAWEDNRGATAAEMLAAVTATEALATTGVVDVEIGGLTGKQFDVRLNPDWTETCPGDPPGLDLGDQRYRMFFLDRPADNPLVIFVASLHAADHEAHLAEAMPVVESLQFDLGQ